MTNNIEPQLPSEPRPFKSDPDQARLKRKALIAFALLLIGVFAVVIFLPAMLAERERPVVLQPEQEAVSVEDEAKAEEVQALTREILKHQARLENDGIRDWGIEELDTSYGAVLQLMEEAHASASEKRYDSAIEQYLDVKGKLKRLEGSRTERAERAMEAGNEAYAKLDHESAVRHFAIAAAADPDNREARTRLERAGNLPGILNLIEEGQKLEQSGQLTQALGKYVRAIEIDGELPLARDHFHRLDAVVSDRLFRQSMSEARSSLDRGELKRSRASIDVAKGLRPDTGVVGDLEHQLKNMETLVGHQQLGREALQYEHDEEWEKAVDAYNRILETDADDSFALQGKERAQQHIAIIGQIKSYLDQPDRLQEPEYREHARKIYELAAVQKDAGQKLRGLNGQLKYLIDQYNSPVPVVILSDSLTDVRIYHVGQFGPLKEKSVNLLPGRYQALGTRSGYRDVMVPFTVTEAGEDIKVEVICKEPI